MRSVSDTGVLFHLIQVIISPVKNEIVNDIDTCNRGENNSEGENKVDEMFQYPGKGNDGSRYAGRDSYLPFRKLMYNRPYRTFLAGIRRDIEQAARGSRSQGQE